MNIFFSILSIVYIPAIFILAGSPIVRLLAPFNPYSFLHIPLYGILTFLLIFSFIHITQLPKDLITNKRIDISPLSRLYASTHVRFLAAEVITLGVGIADEIHQAYVPGRGASVTNVLLDLVGIGLVLFFAFRLLKTKTV